MFFKNETEKPKAVASAASCSLTVDYSKSIEELLSHYEPFHDDFLERGITSVHFPAKGKSRGRVDITVELIHFDGFVPYRDAKKRLVGMGLRPATMGELLSFGIQYPARRDYFIVALGSIWNNFGSRQVGYLRDHGLGVGLFWYGTGMCGGDRFLAVRE